jgi:hypothetical protein
MRNLLIGGQVAASLLLLIVGGVLIRNIQRLDSVDPGYDLSRVFDLRLDQPTATTLALLGQQPGVGAVTAVERVPLYGRLYQLPVTAEGRTTLLSYNYLDHHYFETLALPVEGRSFTVAETSARTKVAVISQATARKALAHGVATRPNIRDRSAERRGRDGRRCLSGGRCRPGCRERMVVRRQGLLANLFARRGRTGRDRVGDGPHHRESGENGRRHPRGLRRSDQCNGLRAGESA